jgi:hypothetical protein
VVRIVDRVDNGVNGPVVVVVGMALLLLLDDDCLIAGERDGSGLRSMVGLELCGLPFLRGVFDLDCDAPLLPLVAFRDEAGLRLEFRPRCCFCC